MRGGAQQAVLELDLQVDAGLDATRLEKQVDRSDRKRAYDECFPAGRLDLAVDSVETEVLTVRRTAQVDISTFNAEERQEVVADERFAARFLLVEVERIGESIAKPRRG